MYEQAVLPIADPETFGTVKIAVESSFAPDRVAGFLKSVERAKLRVRDVEAVLRKGLLGAATAGEYSRLGPSDQGQIREIYLSRLEKVAPELRQKFLKLYAYY
ncbi:MAG: hypothetical protein ABI072_10085 [Edaphobacter sp.]